LRSRMGMTIPDTSALRVTTIAANLYIILALHDIDDVYIWL
jgi:hypothetical protein